MTRMQLEHIVCLLMERKRIIFRMVLLNMREKRLFLFFCCGNFQRIDKKMRIKFIENKTDIESMRHLLSFVFPYYCQIKYSNQTERQINADGEEFGASLARKINVIGKNIIQT